MLMIGHHISLHLRAAVGGGAHAVVMFLILSAAVEAKHVVHVVNLDL